jgi:hypothetical protein
MGLDDWLHRKVFSSSARIRDNLKIPQQLFNMVSDVDISAVSFADHMLGGNDVRGYMVGIIKPKKERLELLVDSSFQLVDFKVWFPVSRTNYGITNIFQPGLQPKRIIDAFWAGKGEDDTTHKIDVVLEGRLDNDKPLTGDWEGSAREARERKDR